MRSLFESKSRIVVLALLAAAASLVVITVALGAWLDGDDGWTQATAAASLGATVIATGALLGTAQGWANGRRISLAATSTAVIGLGALALVVVTYIGGASDAGMSGGTSVSQTTEVGAALSEQVSNNEIQPPGYAHDVGPHPSFDAFISMDAASVIRNSPGGTLLPDEVGPLQEQLRAARAFAETVDTAEKARAAGYFNTTNDVPFMGAHFINGQYLSDGVFDAGKPEGLLFSKLGGGPDAEWQLVGVWYLIIPGGVQGVTASIPPEGFKGTLDLWHEHYGLCTRDGIISENNTQEGCRADSGRWTGDLRWMMHVWVWPESADNPEGVFTYLNENLWRLQGNVQGEPLGLE